MPGPSGGGKEEGRLAHTLEGFGRLAALPAGSSHLLLAGFGAGTSCETQASAKSERSFASRVLLVDV